MRVPVTRWQAPVGAQRGGWLRGALVLGALLGAAWPVLAQEQPGAARARPDTSASAAPGGSAFGAEPTPASPPLPSDHWAFRALRRLSALGLLDEAFDGGTPALTCAAAAALVRVAGARAPAGGAAAALAATYDSLFAQDPQGCPTGESPLVAVLGPGYERTVGGALAGVGYDPGDWTGTRPGAASSTPLLQARLGAVARHASLLLAPEAGDFGARLRDGQAVLAAGPVALWAGRRRFRFGPSVGGGIVLSDAVAFDGAGGYLERPIHFPWLLRAMGPIRMESFVSRVRGGDRIRDPYFIAFRGTMSPHPRLVVGLSRAAMFGGQGNAPITLRNLTFLLTGNLNSSAPDSFANDMLSADVQWRPPISALPLLTYLEWGMDDGAGAWHHEPGIVAGAYLATLPGLPALGAGLEWTFFSHHYFQNSIWYRNPWLRNGWTDGGLPVGSPLGGQGQQALGYVEGLWWGGRVDARASVFYRYRGPENLLAPERQGVSEGGGLQMRLRAGRRVSLRTNVDLDVGRSWTAASFSSGIELRAR